jgi:hypothetical protein
MWACGCSRRCSSPSQSEAEPRNEVNDIEMILGDERNVVIATAQLTPRALSSFVELLLHEIRFLIYDDLMSKLREIPILFPPIEARARFSREKATVLVLIIGGTVRRHTKRFIANEVTSNQ